MRMTIAVLAALLIGTACAQTTARAATPDPALIFQLLGTVRTIELDVQEQVHTLHLATFHGSEAVRSVSYAVQHDTYTMALSMGTLARLGDCPLLLFTDLVQTRPAGSGQSQSVTCLVLPDIRTVRSSSFPLGSLHEPLELPLDTWLPLELVNLWTGAPETEPDSLNNAIVFYLYQNTGEDDPEAPQFSSREEFPDAFR